MGKSQKDIIAARTEKVDKRLSELEEQGYVKKDLSANGNKVNLLAIITGGIPAVIMVVLFGFIHGWLQFNNMTLIIIIYLLSVVVHELIHGLFFAMFAKERFKSIEFGIIWKSLNPYCYCSEPINKPQYMTALLMPGFILGVCTGVIGIIIGNASLLAFGALNMLSAGGDIFIARLILKNKGKKGDLYLDHPSMPGLFVLTKE